MAKLMITKNQIKEIIQEHKDPQINEAIEKWAEKILIDIIHQLQEEQDLKEEKLATKEDLKMVLEKMETRFEYLIKEMNTRFEAVQKEMNTRFEAMQKENNARFESLEKRHTQLMWMIGVGFTMLGIINLIVKFS